MNAVGFTEHPDRRRRGRAGVATGYAVRCAGAVRESRGPILLTPETHTPVPPKSRARGDDSTFGDQAGVILGSAARRRPRQVALTATEKPAPRVTHVGSAAVLAV